MLRHDRARHGGDARARLMAHALDALTAVAPATVAVISPVDRNGRPFNAAPVVARLDPPTLSLDIERIHLSYLAGPSTRDPFAPRRWADRDITVVGTSDVGGSKALRCGLLASHRLSRRAAVFVRDRGRLVAYAVLVRGVDEPDLTAAELERLRRVQPLVAGALLLVGQRSAPSSTPAELRARGLTPREAEVAALAATGATNAEIARELFISVNTVKTHVGRALAKLDLRSRTELALSLSGRR